MTHNDPTIVESANPDDDASILFDTLPPEDLTADKYLRDVARTNHRSRTMPILSGIPLFRRLGEGGLGAVYYGVHLRLQREVAVKVMKLADGDKNALARFEREARVCCRIRSPHLVEVYDISESHGLHFMVLEFVRGGSGADVIKQITDLGQPLKEGEALDFCIAATEGLCAAHEQGIIHRDIKPANILVPKSKEGEWLFKDAKLADLGLARFEAAGQSLTQDNAFMGTPGYMSPEQAKDAKHARKPADVFSMGATLYAMLTGKSPFTGGSLTEVLIKTVQSPHTPIMDLRPEVTPATRTLIDQCLAKNPEQRFTDAHALLDALKVCRSVVGEATASQMKAAAELTVLQRRPEVGNPVVDSDPTPPLKPNAPVSAPAATKRAVPVWIYAAAAIALVTSIAVVVKMGRSSPNDSATTKPPVIPEAKTNVPTQPPTQPTVVQPTEEKITLSELAKSLGGKLSKKSIKKLAVLEFLDESTGERQLGGKIGAAGKYFAGRTEEQLMEVDGASYTVFERARFDKVLEEMKFQTGNLVSPDGLKELQKKIAPVDVIVLGIVRRAGRDVQVTLKALGMPDGSVLAMASGTLALTPDLIGLFGNSYYQPPDAVIGVVSPEKVLMTVEASPAAHPLTDNLEPYRIEIVEDNLALPYYIHGSELYVPADKGKPYTIRLKNTSSEGAVVALLIDGLNTIDQKRVAPSEGLKWALKPGATIEVKGWQSGVGKAKEFVFTNASESLAARQQFCTDIGLITAVFYRAPDLRGTMGTGAGKDVDSSVKELNLQYDKTASAVLNIRYDLRSIVEGYTRVEESKLISK